MTQRIGLSNRPDPGFQTYVKSQTMVRSGNQVAPTGAVINKRYYSQVDAEIYFGDIFVDEVVAIQCSLSQNTQAITGFNSFVYDSVAQGARLASGSFTVNFTMPGYLDYVIGELRKLTAARAATSNAQKNQENTKSEQAVGEASFAQSGALWPAGFDIDLMLGQKTKIGDPVHMIIEGVILTGNQTVLDASGKVMLEQYAFIARDLRPIR